MFKHLKPKDIIEFLAFGLGFVALIVIAGFLESSPIGISMWIAVVLALLLWIVWAIIVINDRKAQAATPRLKIMRNGQWVDVTPSIAREFTGNSPRRDQIGVYDQDEDAIRHLDYNPKEKKA